MFNLEKADKIFEAKMREDSRFAERFIKKVRALMPDVYAKTMYEEEYGCHIVDISVYEKAVSLLEWADGKGYGAKFDVDDILKMSNIDFSNKNYYEYDYAYVVNMLYSDYGHIITELSQLLKMAKAYLEDPDYMGKADERAYHNAMKRIKYNQKSQV